MITSVCWVPKGVTKIVHADPEQPTEEEIENMVKNGVLERSGDSDEEEEDEEMEAEPSGKADEVAHALAAVEALGKTDGSSSVNGLDEITKGLQDIMAGYDEEEDVPSLFGNGLNGVYYEDNSKDPHILNNDVDSDEDSEDIMINPTDAVLVCACIESDYNYLQVVIFRESEDGEPEMEPYNEIPLPSAPVCTAWLDCKPKSGESAEKGNFIAVGSMEPAIEIFDINVLVDAVEPVMVLGGASKKKRKGKKTPVKYKKGSHKDAVLDLAWNKEFRNVLASSSADKAVKLWNVDVGKCVATAEHHTDHVQAVAWNQYSPQVLLSGSVDESVVMIDCRSSTDASSRWSVPAKVESLAWDRHNEHTFVVSLGKDKKKGLAGLVQGFDIRAASSNSSSASKPIFTLHAHDKDVTSVCYSPSAPNLIATASTDKMVKLWDLSNNQPSCVASRNTNSGKVLSISFSEDSPFLLAIGGLKGVPTVWDTLTDPGVARSFGKYSNRKTADPMQTA